jgi:hypothetical protein
VRGLGNILGSNCLPNVKKRDLRFKYCIAKCYVKYLGIYYLPQNFAY